MGSSFGYVYDVTSNVTQRTYPDGTTVAYTYDPLRRMATVSSGGKTTTYAYDAASNLVTTTLPAANGYGETRSYDNAGRLTEVKSQKGASVLADITYSRDQAGNPLTETRTGTSPVTKTFSYDQMDRLTGVCFQAGSCPGGSDPFIRWDYDGVGNRLSETRPAGSTSYSYDQVDRLLSAGATSYTWDRNGNQLTAGSRSFTWDLANRLKTTAASGTTTTYSYDGDGKRLQASTGSGNNAKTNYTWDPNGALPMLVREASGNNGLLRRYVNSDSGPVFMSTTGSNAFYYHPDALGSVRNVTDTAGATQPTYDYEPYGTVRTRTGTLANFVKFTGQYQDPTGLYHLRARQYDPATGRFLSLDPKASSAPSELRSSYVYANNRTTVLGDPSGLGLIRVDSCGSIAAAYAASPSGIDEASPCAGRTLYGRTIDVDNYIRSGIGHFRASRVINGTSAFLGLVSVDVKVGLYGRQARPEVRVAPDFPTFETTRITDICANFDTGEECGERTVAGARPGVFQKLPNVYVPRRESGRFIVLVDIYWDSISPGVREKDGVFTLAQTGSGAANDLQRVKVAHTNVSSHEDSEAASAPRAPSSGTP